MIDCLLDKLADRIAARVVRELRHIDVRFDRRGVAHLYHPASRRHVKSDAENPNKPRVYSAHPITTRY